jgi:hypothetical protein
MSMTIRSTSFGVFPRNNVEILSGCHFKLSACITLNNIEGELASGHAFLKKVSTFDAFRSAKRPDFTGHGIASRDLACFLELVLHWTPADMISSSRDQTYGDDFGLCGRKISATGLREGT